MKIVIFLSFFGFKKVLIAREQIQKNVPIQEHTRMLPNMRTFTFPCSKILSRRCRQQAGAHERRAAQVRAGQSGTLSVNTNQQNTRAKSSTKHMINAFASEGRFRSRTTWAILEPQQKISKIDAQIKTFKPPFRQHEARASAYASRAARRYLSTQPPKKSTPLFMPAKPRTRKANGVLAARGR